MNCGRAPTTVTTFIGSLAREARRQIAIATRGFHDQNVRFDVLEAGLSQNGLIVETDIARVKERFLFSAHHDAGGAQRVAGVKKFQRGRRKPASRFLVGRPFDFPIVFESLEAGRDFIHFIVGIKRVFLDAQVVALVDHDVN